MALEHAGIGMHEIEDIPGVMQVSGRKKSINFQMGHPRDAVYYAAADPIATLLLHQKFGPIVEKMHGEMVRKIEQRW